MNNITNAAEKMLLKIRCIELPKIAIIETTQNRNLDII